MDIDSLLNAAKKATGVKSDYALAKKLGIGKTRIGNYRTKISRPNLETCFQIAEILDINPTQVIIYTRLETAQNDEEVNIWKHYEERFLR